MLARSGGPPGRGDRSRRWDSLEGRERLLVMDYNLHSKANNSHARTSPAIAMRSRGWSSLEVFTPPELNRPQDNVTNFAVTIKGMRQIGKHACGNDLPDDRAHSPVSVWYRSYTA